MSARPGGGAKTRRSQDRGVGDSLSEHLNENGALGAAGAALWASVTAEHQELDASQQAMLLAACRQRDRADSLAGKAAEGDVSALRHEREASLAMARLMAALRLPDPRTGKRPQLRAVRGVHAGPTPTTAVDRARARAERKSS